MTFRLRLALLIAVVVTGLLVVSGSAFVLLTQQIVRQSVDRELRGRLRNFMDANHPQDDFMGRPMVPRSMPGLGPRFFPPPGVTDDTPPEPYDAAALNAVKARGEKFSDVVLENVHARVLTAGMPDGAKVQVAYNMQDVERLAQTQTTLLLFVVPASVMLAAAFAWFLADQAVRPIERISRAAATVSQDALDARIPVSGNDEIAALARQFNQMLARLESSFQQREKLLKQVQAALESQTAFVADASHELRTPLARMKLLTSSVLHQETDVEGMRRALTKIDQGADDMTSLVSQLLLLARHDAGSAETFANSRLSEVVDRASALTEAVPGPGVVWGEAPAATVAGRPEDLARVLANVIENAKKYAPDYPTVDVGFENSPEAVTVVVSDRGPGIAPEHLPRLTERFFRADASRNRSTGGTGLGLAIVKAVLESNGGGVVVESHVGVGTQVRLRLKKVV